MRSLFPLRLRFLSSRSSGESSNLDADSFRSRDDEINKNSSPPPGEHIDVRCIWGIEFYTPSQMDALETNLRNLGWDDTDDPWLGNNPISWLREQRHRTSGSAIYLGLLTTAESPPLCAPTHTLSYLPPHVSYAHGWMSSLSPSLVAISLCFTLDEDVSDIINTSLCSDRKTILVPRGYGESIHDPYFQKRDDVARTRSELQGSVRDWFAKHLPGAFSSSSVALPTCELITARIARPYVHGDSSYPGMYSYLRSIGFVTGADSWRADSVAGLVLVLPRDSNHSHIAVNDADLDAALGSGYSQSRTGSVHYLDELMGLFLQSWAVLPLLDSYTTVISANSIPANNDPEHVLGSLEDGQLSRIDVAALSNELSDDSNDSMWILHDAPIFTRTFSLRDGRDTSLDDDLRFVIRRRARWLKETDRAVRENASQYGTLLAAIENIRLQKSVNRLTRLLTLLGIVGTAAAVLAALAAANCFPG